MIENSNGSLTNQKQQFFLGYSELEEIRKNILISELLKEICCFGIVAENKILPLTKPTQAPFTFTPSCSRVIPPLIALFKKMNEQLKHDILSELLQRVSATFVVGAFEANRLEDNLQILPGCHVFPVYPGDETMEAIANAIKGIRSGGYHPSLQQATHSPEEAEFASLLEELTSKDTLAYTAMMLQCVEIDGIMPLSPNGIVRTFPVSRPEDFNQSCASLKHFEQFKKLPKEAQARLLTELLRTVPISIVIGAFLGDPQTSIKRYALSAYPVENSSQVATTFFDLNGHEIDNISETPLPVDKSSRLAQSVAH